MSSIYAVQLLHPNGMSNTLSFLFGIRVSVCVGGGRTGPRLNNNVMKKKAAYNNKANNEKGP